MFKTMLLHASHGINAPVTLVLRERSRRMGQTDRQINRRARCTIRLKGRPLSDNSTDRRDTDAIY